MNWPWPFDITFLGAGGKVPRLEALMGSGETRRLLELPPMHSTYAIDIEYEEGTLAIGTKGGLVYILAGNGNLKTAEPIIKQKLAQETPVLSVCWITKAILSVSDTAARCLLWYTDQEQPPQRLDTRGETICSLLNLGDGLLAGLALRGKLFFWQLLEGRLVHAIDVPIPPPTSALVRMVYWPSENALAFPGRSGNMILVGLGKNEIRELEAHKGLFYAISVWGDDLLTVGMEDSWLKVWEPGSDKPTMDYQVMEGVISAAALNNRAAKILLVEAQGKANAYTLDDGKLKSIKRLTGEDYRVAVAPAPQRIQALIAKRQEEEVRRIVSEIRQVVGRVPDQVIDEHLSRLSELGYVQVSLAIRAQQADKKGELVEGLGIYCRLLQILPQDNPKAFASMKGYACLLEKAWQVREANDVYELILDIDPTYRFTEEANQLEEITKLVREKNWIIKPEDIPIEHIIQSATVIKKRFTGRYVIKILAPVSCQRQLLSPDMIAEKYERVRRESSTEGLPGAIVEQVWLISRGGYDEIQLVTVGIGETNGIKGLQFSFQVSRGELDTAVIPMVLFDWRDILPGEDVEAGNKRAFSALKRIKKKDLSNPDLGAVHKALKNALERLVTEKRAQGRMHL